MQPVRRASLEVVAMPRRSPPACAPAGVVQQTKPTAACPVDRSSSAHESWVDLVRLIAAFLIVLGHVLNLDRRFQEVPVGSPDWLLIDVLTAALRWALPIFVMISGYFLLDPQRPLNWRSYYRRRLRRIAWPLLAWSVFYLGIVGCDEHLAGRPVDWAAMAGMVIRGAPYYHLWYLYMVPGLYLVAPFLKLATDRMTPNQLVAAVAICFAVTIFSATLDGLYSVRNATYIDDFPRYLGYFLAGHLLGRVLPPRKAAPDAFALLLSIAATAALAWAAAIALSPAQALRVFGFGNPTIIVMSLAAFALIRRMPVARVSRPWLARVGNATLGVYLVHPALLDALRHWTYPHALPGFAAEVAGVFLASLIVVLAMQHTPVLRRLV
jgi:surface polysaccharide O-acyltransferase-like enzyme